MTRTPLKFTIFGGKNNKIKEFLIFAYLFLHKTQLSEIPKIVGISKNTGIKWRKELMGLIANSLEKEDIMIGGKNIIVEMDETKLGNIKYHRGHKGRRCVDDRWS